MNIEFQVFTNENTQRYFNEVTIFYRIYIYNIILLEKLYW